ncbi:MAG: DUF1698 domain-containing protein, partial [Bdellovibrionales bacterium]|nr:DUF1698 domain-containing protein [Bdellovibrionales bacterium]
MRYDLIPDPIRSSNSLFDVEQVINERNLALDKISRLESWAKIRRNLELLPMPKTGLEIRELEDDYIKIGTEADLTHEQHLLLIEILRSLIPWRVGPYNLFGHKIETEWNSYYKWSRIKPYLG